MKNKFAFILAALCLTACSLEETPYGFYSEGSFYKTEADAQAATMYIYDAINYIEYSQKPTYCQLDYPLHKNHLTQIVQY